MQTYQDLDLDQWEVHQQEDQEVVVVDLPVPGSFPLPNTSLAEQPLLAPETAAEGKP